MKGIWKTKLGGYNHKSIKRKKQNFNQFVSDNSLYNIRNDKYYEEDSVYYLFNKAINDAIVFGKLDDWNKARQFESNLVDRKTRRRVKEYVINADWDSEIKEVYGAKSIDYLVS